MTISVPVNDLERHNRPILNELQEAAAAVVASGWYILGPRVRQFEAGFAAFCGAPHCVGVGNGTDALELALRAVGAGPGDHVAAVANAGGYGTAAILATGAEPRYVDVEPAGMSMDPRSLAAAITPRTRAVIVTHLYGYMADMPSLLEAAGGLPVIEDCAQAHGARLGGRHAGTWGAIGCFSFYPTKNLGALGDGGALVCSDGELAARLGALRQYGWTSKYTAGVPRGRNSRLDEMQAAILLTKLPYLEGWNRRRREIAESYGKALTGLGLELPPVCGTRSATHLYVVRSPRRDALREALGATGIGTDIHYPVPDHRQPAAVGHSWAAVSLPVTERCCREALTLPCFPEMTGEEVRRVIDAVGAAAVRC
ncbi:MAG TPA: DegT/DnrJ/EryC1/StrS family aminotransferase [Bryobacteraceae bacterium]|nr:DegT/DnrJ/EryC1/StrS family aminotransferase [Bryobacteraceae bacterium]